MALNCFKCNIRYSNHRSGNDEELDELDVLCQEIVNWWQDAEDRKKEPSASTEEGKSVREAATKKLKNKSEY